MSRPLRTQQKPYRAVVRGFVPAPAGHDFMAAFDDLRAIAARLPESAEAPATAATPVDECTDFPCT